MKISKTQIQMLYNIYKAEMSGDAYASSEWVNGMGKHTSRKAIPPFCERIFNTSAKYYPNRIKRYFKKRPRVESFIVITNMRSAKKLLKNEGLIEK